MRAFKKVLVVMPAYNAAATLERTVRDIPSGSVSEMILTDDGSVDATVACAKKLGLTVICHGMNRGYGANQKTCYAAALERDADVIVMLHPDYQYDPRMIPAAVDLLKAGCCDIVLGSRIGTRAGTLAGGMPVYKYMGNRILTIFENICFGQKIGDFHTGFRVYAREVLEAIPFTDNSNGFVFDTEVLAQAIYHGFKIGEVPMPTRYFPEASSIGFWESVKYGVQTMCVVALYLLRRAGMQRIRMFDRATRSCNATVCTDNRRRKE